MEDKETTDDHQGFALSGLKIIDMHVSNIQNDYDDLYHIPYIEDDSTGSVAPKIIDQFKIQTISEEIAFNRAKNYGL